MAWWPPIAHQAAGATDGASSAAADAPESANATAAQARCRQATYAAPSPHSPHIIPKRDPLGLGSRARIQQLMAYLTPLDGGVPECSAQ
eukprot:7376379-Prymnesium_polylepis.1